MGRGPLFVLLQSVVWPLKHMYVCMCVCVRLCGLQVVDDDALVAQLSRSSASGVGNVAREAQRKGDGGSNRTQRQQRDKADRATVEQALD